MEVPPVIIIQRAEAPPGGTLPAGKGLASVRPVGLNDRLRSRVRVGDPGSSPLKHPGIQHGFAIGDLLYITGVVRDRNHETRCETMGLDMVKNDNLRWFNESFISVLCGLIVI